jgi:2-isopropylmalate synthase
VRERLHEAGFDPTDAELRAVTRRVKEFGAGSERVTVAVLERFAREVGVSRTDGEPSEEVRA